MRAKEAAKIVAGSIVVYVIMAACAASGPMTVFVGDDGSTTQSGSSGGEASAPGSGGSSDTSTGSGAILDALTDPIAEANAQTLPPITATESCTKTTPFGDAGLVAVYAEHAFPGYTAQQLARVVAVETLNPPNNPLLTAGYPQVATGTYVRDGYVASFCGYVSGTTVQSVTFILPQ